MDPVAELLGDSAAIEAVRRDVRRLVAGGGGGRRLPAVLIEGETGTGKGLLARVIHRAGPRARGPFVDVNCAAIPETLLEAELFGFERGAFTDARRSKPGLFQAAHRGILFLDEVGLLPEPLQAKLLKVLEEQAVRRLGATQSEPVDVWVVSATNADLAGAVRQRAFREDLYHRLAVVRLRLPPLRERGRDVLALAERFLARACAAYGLAPRRLAPDAGAALLAYPWPGNVRELGNVMERVALLAEEELVTAGLLGLPVVDAGPGRPPSAPPPVDEVLAQHLAEALERTGWNISRTAALLGLARNTVRARIARFGLQPVEPGRARPGPGRARGPRSAAPPVTPAPPSQAAPAAVSAIRWERRRVTLLRASVAGDADPEALGETSRALDLVTDKVRAFGGRVQEVGGTWLGAAFGLEPGEDAAGRAAHAAMAIQKGLHRLATPDVAPRALRVGLHVADLLVATTPDGPSMDADAARGAWAALAALAEAAPPGAVLVSAGAAPFLGRHFALRPEPPAGPDAPGAQRLMGRHRGTAPRWLTAFVGRRQELELLKQRLAAVQGGEGQIVCLVGEAGIGKSRLLHEFRQLLREGGVNCLEGHCHSYGAQSPYLPVVELLRRGCRITASDPPQRVAGRLRAALERLGLDAGAALPYLLRFLGLKEGTEALDAQSSDGVRRRTAHVLRQMLVAASRQRRLVLVVEDLHWVDAASEGLGAALDNLHGVPVLLVLTYRPGYQPSWIHRPHVTRLALQPLSPEESLHVVSAVLPPHLAGEPVARSIAARGEGNPFFLEELARNAGERRELAPDLVVPGTVEEVLRTRMDQLSPRARSLLQAAAVVGKNVPRDLLRGVTGWTEEALEDGLDALRVADFLYEMEPGPQGQDSFKHQLTQEVAYRTLLPAERRALHARALESLQRLQSQGEPDHADRLAHHAVSAEAWDRAVVHLRDAGRQALARSANHEAAARFEQALRALDHLPPDRPRQELAVDLRFDLRNALTPLAETERALAALRQAEVIAGRLGDARRLGRALAFAANVLHLMGQSREAIEVGTRARAVAVEAREEAIELATDMYLGRAYHALGDYRRAIEALARTVTALSGPRVRERLELPVLPAVFSRALLAACYAETGDFPAGTRLTTEAVVLGDAADHPDTALWAQWSAGYLSLRQGDTSRAAAAFQRALALCRTHDLPVYMARATAGLALTLALEGRLAEAAPMAAQAVAEAEARRQAASLPWVRLALGQVLGLAGRLAEARQVGTRCLEEALARGERGHQAYALCLLADTATPGEPGAPSDGGYGQAIVLAEALGMRPLEAWSRLGLGRWLGRTGERAGARAALAAARDLFRDMQMPDGAARAERALAELAP
jgi:transcriptional regulator with AAA-type ATPase domain/tetratricopeptide (TPR) repeat protein